MAQIQTTGFILGKKYLFKTGLDSYVVGTLKAMYVEDFWLKDASVQIPPDKVNDFITRLDPVPTQSVHSDMIINQVNIQWAVPAK